MERITSTTDALAACYEALEDMLAEVVIYGHLAEGGESDPNVRSRWYEMNKRYSMGYAYLNRHDPDSLTALDAAHRRYAFVRDMLRGARAIA